MRTSAITNPRDAGGYVLGLVLHVALLLTVGAMVVFLASRYRVRVDLTADRLYTLTDSTRRVLERVEERLRIEAYFSPDADLAMVNREGRRTLRHVLDEYVQQGRGRVVVQYLDPLSDNELRKKAERLGVKPQHVQDMEGTTLSNREVWQGLRFLYGGDKQKVVPIIGFTERSALYEAALTPIVKAMTVAEKPRIGVMQWRSVPAAARGFGRQEQPLGYDRVLNIEQITDRYELVTVDLSLGQLVPDDLETLILLRPKELTDRQKYAFDQFVMRGGRLAVFADSDEVSLGGARTLRTRSVSWDAPGSTVAFLDQLAHYGAVVHDRFLIDSGSAAVQFGIVAAMPVGGQVVNALQALPFYPYWFQPTAVDWAERAEIFAQRDDGTVDQALATAYRAVFLPGVDPERAKGLAAAALFWPCAVDLAESLPEGVEGHVLMRSSPRSVLQTPPQSVNPIGSDRLRAQATYDAFVADLAQLLRSENLRQFGLLVSLGGSFPSFFEGRRIPARPGTEDHGGSDRDPLDEPIGADPVKDDEIQGPEVPGRGDPEPAEPRDQEPEPLLAAASTAQLVVIADATFLRDDLVGGDYQQVGGPVSTLGPLFFANLLDWLAQDRDLYELRAKGLGVDRRLRFLSDAELEQIAPARLQQEIDGRVARARFANVALPPVLLVVVGVAVLLVRSGRKRRFLARSGS